MRISVAFACAFLIAGYSCHDNRSDELTDERRKAISALEKIKHINAGNLYLLKLGGETQENYLSILSRNVADSIRWQQVKDSCDDEIKVLER